MKEIKSYPIALEASRYVSQLLEAGRYDAIDPDIAEVLGKGPLSVCANDYANKGEFHVLQFDDVTGTKSILCELDRQGLRACSLRELVVMVALHPEPTLPNGALIALGSRIYASRGPSDDGYFAAPAFRATPSGRSLRYCVDDGWARGVSFLAIRR